ncbi:hypothetical protein D6764_02990 [Candidatus Woesearchaeota archaeon]|nr:MAG: hypothetical protein D6764_02990 [Candidatus Woesearchaeota archaeon]
MNIEQVLKDWAVNYVKHKDIIRRQIVDIEIRDDRLVVKEKNGSYEVLIRPVLDGFANEVPESGKCLVVTLNSEKNMKALVVAWDAVKRIPGLTIIFVNPASDVPQYWALVPKTHAIVADESSLLQGFKSLSESVALVDNSVGK